MLASAPATAAPKGAEAKAQFDRGVAAYQKGDFVTAADALGKSEALESDPETLYALAQTERKLERCDLALPLYDKLLATDMPKENRDTVTSQRAECKQILATKPAEPAASPAPAPAPAPAAAAPVAQPAPAEGRPWWHNPVGDTLVILGVAGIGVGTGYLVAGHSADSSKSSATTYTEFKTYSDRATSDGKIGVTAVAAGAGLVAVGVIWYVVHGGESHAPVTGWLAPHSGGLALSRSF
ncbi:MAG TPA: hypothetical protein VMJ10_01580 [Kofleriaceae bacterium]|nr:hypothetical protein [Kofleriaceae bacterium]